MSVSQRMSVKKRVSSRLLPGIGLAAKNHDYWYEDKIIPLELGNFTYTLGAVFEYSKHVEAM